MRQLIFRAAASADLRGIARYTRARWGDEQAAEYVSNLRHQIKSLRAFPLRFPEFEGGQTGLRQMIAGRQAYGGDPAAAFYPEGVLGCGLDMSGATVGAYILDMRIKRVPEFAGIKPRLAKTTRSPA